MNLKTFNVILLVLCTYCTVSVCENDPSAVFQSSTESTFFVNSTDVEDFTETLFDSDNSSIDLSNSSTDLETVIDTTFPVFTVSENGTGMTQIDSQLLVNITRMVDSNNNVSNNCSSLLQKIMLPEEAVVNFSDSFVPLTYCKQAQSSIAAAVCSENEGDASSALKLMSAMLEYLCSSSSTYMTVMVANGFNCIKAQEIIITNCTSSKTRSYAYASELLASGMIHHYSCKDVSNVRRCINSGLSIESACSADQKLAVRELMAFMVKEQCVSEPSSTMEPKMTSKMVLVQPSDFFNENHATGMQPNALIFLPLYIALLIFKF